MKNKFFQHQYQKQVKMFVFISWLALSHEACIYIQYFFGAVRNISFRTPSTKYQLSENYKPMRVWLWLVYKFTQNYCRLWLLSDFIQTQKRYTTSLTCHIKLKFVLWAKVLENLLLAKYLTSVAMSLTTRAFLKVVLK